MANVNRPSSVEKCIEDITECSICSEVLLDNRCLPCLHTFCLKCLEAYKRGKTKDKTMQCPVCRRDHPTPKRVADLPRNFFIDKLIDAHRSKEQDVPKICEICEGSKVVKATHFCCDCHQNICLSCERQHKKIKATMMHRIVYSTSVTDTQKLSPRPTYCKDHTTKEAEVYCQDCKMAICWRCKFHTHISHDSIELNIAAKDLVKNLEKHIGEISEHVRNKQDDIRKLKEREKSYTDEIDAESMNICREINKLYRMITDNGDSLKKALTASTTVPLNEIRSLVDKLETDVSELKKHKVYIEQMMHLGSVSDLCEYTDTLISETARMSAASTSSDIAVPSVTHLSDLDLQNLLIGRRTDIDQQYNSNNSKEQAKDDPNEFSKEEVTKAENSLGMMPSMLKIRNGAGNYEDIDKRRKNQALRRTSFESTSRTISRDNIGKLQCKRSSSVRELSEDAIEEETRNCEDTATPIRMVFGSEQRGRVAQNPSYLPGSTQTIAAKPLQRHTQNQDELLPTYRNWSLEGTLNLKYDEAVTGLTILESKLYTVFQNSSNIKVYDSAEFVFLGDFTMSGLFNPNDMASCKLYNCLYICDWGSKYIFRTKIGKRMEHMSWSIDGDIGNISVTAEHSVLLAGYLSCKLKEYTSKGQLIRLISLEDGFKPWHAIKLFSGDFLICQGDNSSAPHRVCIAGSNGELKMSFGGDKGSDEAHLCGPYHLAVDEGGCILVNDCNNRRILALSQDLKFIGEIIPSSAKVLRRARRIYLDKDVGRLYVADNETTASETKDGRIQVFSVL